MAERKKKPKTRKTREELDAETEEPKSLMPWIADEDDSPPEPDPEPEPERVESPEPVSRVALRVYLAACSHKWDQMAGFKFWAKAKSLGPLPMKEWQEAYQDYLNRPVK